MGSSAPLQFVGNPFAVAMLIQGGSVLTWGDSSKGGDIPASVDPVFVKRIYANRIAFAAIKTTQKIISWGDFPQQYIPDRIRDIGGTSQVTTVEIDSFRSGG